MSTRSSSTSASTERPSARSSRRTQARGLECVLRVRDEDELEEVLELVDPEILLLSAEEADDDQDHLERLLELLPDIPAGKLAIAELAGASRDDVLELERAGVDAVIVSGSDIGSLVGDTLPDVCWSPRIALAAVLCSRSCSASSASATGCHCRSSIRTSRTSFPVPGALGTGTSIPDGTTIRPS